MSARRNVSCEPARGCGALNKAAVRFLPAVFGFAILFIMCSLALPEQALAWGPGVHMVTGNWLLQNLYALPPDVASILMRYPGQYLHGCLSADIFIGKGSKARKGHSHNWESGLALMQQADSRRRLAYAYGYLSHLAADIVAHNVYVPGAMDASPGPAKFAHVYLEMQADRMLTWDVTDALSVFREAGSGLSSSLLRQSMHQKALAFWLKKHIFRGSIALGGTRVWRGSLNRMDGMFPLDGRAVILEELLTISTRSIVSILQDPYNSPVLNLDPIGADALALAGARRKNAHATEPLFSRLLPGKHRCPAPVFQLEIPEVLAAFPPVCTIETEKEPAGNS